MVLLVGTIGYAAWDYGGVLPWTQWLVASIAVGAMLLVGCAQLLRWRSIRKAPPVFVLSITALVFIIWFCGYLQTVGLPDNVQRVLSGGSHFAYQDSIPESIRQEALRSDNPTLTTLVDRQKPVSLAVELTSAAIVRPILFACFFLAAAYCCNSRQRIVAVMFLVACLGGLLAFFGIADRLRPEALEPIWLEPDGDIGLPFASYINRNNAAGFLNLSLAAAIGCLTWRFQHQLRKKSYERGFETDDAAWWERIVEPLRKMVAISDTFTFLILLGACLIFTGILISGSRGGFLGAVAGTVGVLVHSVFRGKSFAASLTATLLAIAAFFLLGLVGMTDQVQERLATVYGETTLEDPRWDHWQDSLRTATHYFPAGSGLGTYRYAYLPYQETSAGTWFHNADNLFLELLVEGGFWLPVVLLGIGVICLMAVGRLAKFKNVPHLAALSTIAWFMLISQAVCQAFDFGLLLPANYLAFAVLLGAIIGNADDTRETRKSLRDKPKNSNAPSRNPIHGRLYVYGSLSVVGLLMLSSLQGIRDRAEIDYFSRLTTIWSEQPRQIAFPHAAADARCQQLALQRPEDYFVHLTCCTAALLAERATELRAIREAGTMESNEARQRTALRFVRAMFHLVNSQDRLQLALPTGASLDNFRRARQQAIAALLTCPLDDSARIRLVELDFLADHAASGELLRSVGALRCRSAASLENAAILAAISPGPELGTDLWRQALEVAPGRLRAVWNSARTLMREPLLIAAIPDDASLLLETAEFLVTEPSLKDQLLVRAADVLSQTDSPENSAETNIKIGLSPAEMNRAFQRGHLAELQNRLPAAELFYAIAVENDPTNHQWRFRYGCVLDKLGKTDLAIEHLRRCVLQSPSNVGYATKEREMRNR